MTEAYDSRPVGERVSSLETKVQLTRESIEAMDMRMRDVHAGMDRKIDILLAKADEARGRAETLRMLVSGLPSVVWMMTAGGFVALVSWLWTHK